MSTIATVGRRGTRCPRCDIPLAPVKTGEALLAGCGKCRGVWMDRKAFEKISKREGHPQTFGAAREARRNHLTAKQSLKCPVCYYWMDAKNFENCPELEVDVCRRHGAWLDPNELQATLRFAKGKKDPSPPGNIPTPIAASSSAVLVTVAAASAPLATPAAANQDTTRSTLERSGEFVLELLDCVDISDVGDIASCVAEIGFSLFDGIG